MIEKNKKKNINIILVVVIILIIGVGGYIVYNKFNKENSSEIISLDLTDKIVDSVYRILSSDITPEKYVDTYYQKDKLLVSDISEDQKIHVAALWTNSLEVDFEHGDCLPIKKSDLKNMYKKLFGEELTKEFNDNEDTNYLSNLSNGELYELSDHQYLCTRYAAATSFGKLNKIIKAEKNNTKNELYIYDKVVYGTNSNDNIDFFLDFNRTKKIDTNGDLIVGIDGLLDKNLVSIDDLATFKLTFKGNDDGTYRFYSVEIVK